MNAGDGFRVEINGDRQTCVYFANVFCGEQWVMDSGCICYTEEQARKAGEDAICRLRASLELEALGQPEAAALARRV